MSLIYRRYSGAATYCAPEKVQDRRHSLWTVSPFLASFPFSSLKHRLVQPLQTLSLPDTPSSFTFPCFWVVSLKNTLSPSLSLMASSRTFKNHLKWHIFWEALHDSSRSNESLVPHLCHLPLGSLWVRRCDASRLYASKPRSELYHTPGAWLTQTLVWNTGLLSSHWGCCPICVGKADKGGFPGQFCLLRQLWLLSTVSLVGICGYFTLALIMNLVNCLAPFWVSLVREKKNCNISLICANWKSPTHRNRE